MVFWPLVGFRREVRAGALRVKGSSMKSERDIWSRRSFKSGDLNSPLAMQDSYTSIEAKLFCDWKANRPGVAV